MQFDFRSTVSDRALLAHFNLDRRDWTMAIETELAQHPRIGTDIERLYEAITSAAEALARVAPDRSPEGLMKEGMAQTESLIGPYRLLTEAARREAEHIERETAEHYTPRHPEGSEPAVRVARAEWWRTQSMPQRMNAGKVDLSVAQAVVEFGKAASGLPDEVWDRFVRDTATEQLAARILRDTRMRTAPTVDDPLGGKPDLATARINAAAKLDRMDDERDLLARVPVVLGNAITAAALMSGETREAAFARLSA